MYFYDLNDREVKDLLSGVHARTFWGDNLLMAVVDLDPEAVVPMHSHPHEQGGIVLRGEMTMTIADETRTVKEGDLYVIPGGVEHEARVGSVPVQVLDIFSPVREEYKY